MRTVVLRAATDAMRFSSSHEDPTDRRSGQVHQVGETDIGVSGSLTNSLNHVNYLNLSSAS